MSGANFSTDAEISFQHSGSLLNLMALGVTPPPDGKHIYKMAGTIC